MVIRVLCTVPAAVTGFKVVNRSTSEMFVMWNRPAATNGVLIGYRLTLTGNAVIHGYKRDYWTYVTIY